VRAGQSPSLQLDKDLSSGIWTSVATVGLLSTNALVTLIDPAPPSIAAFYRIRVSTVSTISTIPFCSCNFGKPETDEVLAITGIEIGIDEAHSALLS
jgi:hypothetical protein